MLKRWRRKREEADDGEEAKGARIGPEEGMPSPDRNHPDFSNAIGRSRSNLRRQPRRKGHQQFSRDASGACRAGLDHL